MKKYHWILFMLFILIVPALYGQSARFLIEFSDKDLKNNPFSIKKPKEFLSEKALDRRMRYGIQIEHSDLPISPRYIDSITRFVNTIQNRSKWMNSVVAEIDSSSLFSIQAFTFVEELKFLAPALPVHSKENQKGIQGKDTSEVKDENMVTDSAFYGYTWKPISMLNGHLLHENNHRGKNIIIAVMDAGFRNVDKLPVFRHIRENNQLLGVRDFEENDGQVFDRHNHGTMVLSLMAGYIPEIYIGTAPEASYWLLRT